MRINDQASRQAWQLKDVCVGEPFRHPDGWTYFRVAFSKPNEIKYPSTPLLVMNASSGIIEEMGPNVVVIPLDAELVIKGFLS